MLQSKIDPSTRSLGDWPPPGRCLWTWVWGLVGLDWGHGQMPFCLPLIWGLGSLLQRIPMSLSSFWPDFCSEMLPLPHWNATPTSLQPLLSCQTESSGTMSEQCVWACDFWAYCLQLARTGWSGWGHRVECQRWPHLLYSKGIKHLSGQDVPQHWGLARFVLSCRGSEGPHKGLRQLPWGRGEAPGGAAWPGGCARHGVRIPGSSSVPTWLWLEHNSGMELGKMVMCRISSGAGVIDSSEPVGLTCHRAFGHGSQSHARGPELPLP